MSVRQALVSQVRICKRAATVKICCYFIIIIFIFAHRFFAFLFIMIDTVR